MIGIMDYNKTILFSFKRINRNLTSMFLKLNLLLCLFLIEKQLHSFNSFVETDRGNWSELFVEEEADLELTIASDLAAVTVGQNFTLALEVTNTSPDCVATNIEVEYAIPSGFSLVTILSGDYDENVWTIPTLGPNDGQALLILLLEPNESGNFAHIAEIVAQDQVDPDSLPNNGETEEDDYYTIDILVIEASTDQADLSIELDVNYLGGATDSILYEVELTNQGPASAQNVSIQLGFPSELNIANQFIDDGTFSEDFVWTLTEMPASESASIVLAFANTLTSTIASFEAEIIASDVEDLDSSPNNNVLSEDDQQLFDFTNGTVGNGTGTVGDFVWHDFNGNGLQDAGEPGLQGLGIRLIDENQNLISETTSDQDGNFQFTNVEFGIYRLAFTLTELDMMFTLPEQDQLQETDSDADPVTGLTDLFELTEDNPTNLNMDAGYYYPILLQGFVYNDVNTNGTFDISESGIPGVSINVTSSSTPSITLISGQNGFYELDDVPPGGYSISLAGVPNEIPITSDPVLALETESEEQIDNLNFGLLLPPNDPPCVDTLYACTAPLTEIEICIPNCDPDGNEVFIKDIESIFDCIVSIESNTCVSHLPLPALVVDTLLLEVCDIVAFDTMCVQWMIAIEISESCEGNNNIGDLVWEDSNSNGVQDAGEEGVEGIQVIATNTSGFEYFAFTDENGQYEITNLPDDTYTVSLQNIGGFTYTTNASLEVIVSEGISVDDADFGLLSNSFITPIACNPTIEQVLSPEGSIQICIPICQGAEIAEIAGIESTSAIVANLSADTCFIYGAADAVYNDTLSIQICNKENPNQDLCSDVTVFINVVDGVSPIVEGESVCIVDNQQVVIDALANDSHTTGLPIAITGTTQPAFGTISVDSINNLLIYTPGASFDESDSFNYIVCDELDNCESGEVNILDCPADSCLANAGNLVTPANLNYFVGGTSGTFSNSGATAVAGYNNFYILTTDLDEGDVIDYNILSVNETGVFDFASLGIPAGQYQVHGLSYQGTFEELNNLGLSTGEGVLNQINNNGLCADLIVPGQIINVAEPNPGCIAEGGNIVGTDVNSVVVDASIAAPGVIGSIFDENYSFLFILTESAAPQNILDVNITGTFDLSTYGFGEGDTFEIWGISVIDENADLVSNFSNISDLTTAFATDDLCGDLTENAASFLVIPNTDDCLAQAGTVMYEVVGDNFQQGETFPTPTVLGAVDNDDYDYYFVFTTDVDPNDDTTYDIVNINQTGIFNTPEENLADGIYNVHGLSLLDEISDALPGITSGEAIVDAIENGVCGELLLPGFAFVIGDSCQVEGGSFTNAGPVEITLESDFPQPEITGQSNALNYFNILVLEDVIVLTGDFTVATVDLLGLNNTYEMWGVSTNLEPGDLLGLDFAELQNDIATNSICADLTDGPFVIEVVETTGETCNFAQICVPPFNDTQAPNELCPVFCELPGEWVIDEEDIVSTFNCSVSITGGCVEYLPLPALENIVDSVIVVGCDTVSGICDTAFFEIVIGCIAPIAIDDTYELNGTETSFELDVLANDSLPCNYPLGIDGVLAIDPSIGTVNPNEDNTAVIFEPTPGFSGLVTFEYIATNNCDDVFESLDSTDVLTSQATVTINFDPVVVIEVNAENDTLVTGFNTPLEINALDNDAGVGITVTDFSQPPSGTVTEENGVFTYTPNEDFSGNDSFTYTICDDEINCDQASVIITILEEGNNAPVTEADLVTVENDTTVVIDVLANDTDLDGDTLILTDLIGPEIGTAVINPDGTITYTPDPDAEPGEYTFDYVVCDDGEPILCDTQSIAITVTLPVINQAPIAVNDSVTLFEGDTLDINVLGNDSDPDGDSLTVTITTLPFVGTVEVNEDGTISYIAPAESGGVLIDFFTYQICDDGDPELCSTAQVQVNYMEPPVPIILDLQPDIAYVPAGDFVNIFVLNNDTGDSLFVTSEGTTNPMNGSAVINAENVFVYTPTDGFTGTDYFFYTACDAEGNCETTLVAVIVFEDEGNLAPVLGNNQYEVELNETTILNVLSNDTDPNGDNLIITEIIDGDFGEFVINADQTISFTPNDGLEAGEYIFQYIACDDADSTLCETASVLLAIGQEASNQAPIAVNDTIPVEAMTSIFFNVTDNDSDPNGDDLTSKFGSEPSNGEVDVDDDGLIFYTPNNDFTGIDYFTYIICDTGNPALADTAWATVVVGEVQLGSINAQPDIIQTPINTAVTFSVLGNDTGDGPLSVKEVTGLEFNGTFYAGENGNLFFDEETNSFDYIPESGFVGNDYFCYSMTDGTGACDSTCVSIIVFESDTNLPPQAGNDLYQIETDETVILNVLSNDNDPENQAIEITQILNGPTFGQISINANQTLEYTPLSGFQGEDTFDYIVCETADSTLCDTASVLIAIGTDPSNNPPTAVDDIYSFEPGTVAELNLLSNDSDMDGNLILISSSTDPLAGTLSIDSLGVGTFTPPDSTNTDYLFLYSICDNGVPILCDTAIVLINYGSIDTTVTPPDTIDLPLIEANPDIVQTAVNNPILIPVLANDIGEGIMITGFDPPLNGTIDSDISNGFLYTPNQDFTGMEYFFYTICDTVGQCDSTIVSIDIFASANVAPQSDNDCYEIDGGCEFFDVLINDADPENDTLMLISVGFPEMGSAFIDTETGTIEYCAPAGFVGVDVFTYTACDGFLPGGLCTESTVVVKVGGAEPPNHPPVAQDVCIMVANTESTVISLNSSVIDSDEGDTLTYQLASVPVSGQVILNNFQTGSVIYSPPDSSFIGNDFFTYVVCDDGLPSLCDTAYVKLMVMDTIIINTPIDSTNVIANNDTLQANSGEGVEVFMTTNDFPPEGGVVTIIAEPGFGDLVDMGGNLFVYTSFPEATGQDFFTYSLCVQGICDTAVVVIDVLGCDGNSFMDPELFPIKKGFSPNGDGINEVFDIPNLQACYGDQNPAMKIYNRWGNLVYELSQYSGVDDGNSWNGEWRVSNGGGTQLDVPDGTYYWILTLNDGSSRAGYVEVLR